MNLQEKILKVWRRWSPELLIFAIFLGFGFWINRGVELKGLYMDDLYLWSCYRNQSFTEYVFPMGSSRFRFLFYLASWLELFFIGGHVEWMVPFNISPDEEKLQPGRQIKQKAEAAAAHWEYILRK